MTEFRLADWEHFDAPVDADGNTVRVVHVHTVKGEAGTRIYGVAADGTEWWLRPEDVPNRIIRGDAGWPRLSAEEIREIYANRPIIPSAKAKSDDDSAEEVAARILELPEPEVRARPATLEEIPQGARTIGKRAAGAGFAQRATLARGPRVDQYWRLVEVSTSIMLRGEHPDGRRFAAAWITKTGQRGKSAGVTKWELETAWILQLEDGRPVWNACNATVLSEYLVTPRT